MRIVSFLPAATEIACAIGAGDELVGRSHECDFPRDVQRLPIVSRPSLSLDNMSQGEIDAAVSGQLASGASLYVVDETLLRDLAPDVVFTQDLCQVCAPSGTELTRALATLPSQPEVLWLTPRNLAEIDGNIREIGAATGRAQAAEDVIAANRRRLDAVAEAVAGVPPRRVVFLEWTDPLFCAGHWVPEMLAIAGAHDPFGNPGGDSTRIEWDAVRAAEPELLIVAPCGYGLDRAVDLARTLPEIGVPVVAVDANAYFARPGPRTAEAVELLAHLIHPTRCEWAHDHRPWQPISP